MQHFAHSAASTRRSDLSLCDGLVELVAGLNVVGVSAEEVGEEDILFFVEVLLAARLLLGKWM
jgi:hypothetical protein